MAASSKQVGLYQLYASNRDQTSKDLMFELHEIKYDSDATVEVPTALNHIIGVYGSVSQDVSAPAANVLGSDLTITSGAVTVGATASNSDTFMVIFLGTI